MPTQHEKAAAFRTLHDSGTFIMPNFWDLGSARMLENLGFKSLASTSAGFANAIGKLDSQVTLDEKLDHLSSICAHTNLPVSADFEDGFATQPDETAANLLRAAETGIVGASIEDWSRSAIHDFTLSRDRIQACAEAKQSLPYDFMLTARCENMIRGVNDLDDTINRLVAYEAAGADVLYAPGLSSQDQIDAVLSAVSKPINVLFAFMPKTTLGEFEAMGVRRISLGGALSNHAIGATVRAARAMLDDGDFSWVFDAAPGRTIAELLG